MDNQHPKCECHECTQARARENMGMLGSCNVLPLQCPMCGQYYNALEPMKHQCAKSAQVMK